MWHRLFVDALGRARQRAFRRIPLCHPAGATALLRSSVAPAVAALLFALPLARSALAVGYPAFAVELNDCTEPRMTDNLDHTDRVPAVAALRLASGLEIDLDGRLDDQAWNFAEGACGFRQYEPDRGEPAAEHTVFKVAYDDEALYFGFACFAGEDGAIQSRLSRRDQFVNSDLFGIFIDPYHDHGTGYAFLVNPDGVQQDRYIPADQDGDYDIDWDAVWEARTSVDEAGWYGEMRIPFSSIRYSGGTQSWGLLVSRYLQGRGEEDTWVSWDRDKAGFISRFGHLEGLEQIPPPRQLELLPYAVYRTTDPAALGPETDHQFRNFGLDLKYGLTSNLMVNATVQPDFGQVEADPAVLNLSPYETFFQEKRPFFIEGRSLFEFPSFNLFYTRRIGTGDENSRIRYAAKLTGKTEGGVSIGALAASTDITSEGQAHNLFKDGSCVSRYFVGRLGKEFRRGTWRFNLMQTAVQNLGSLDRCGDFGSREAYTTGADFDLRFRDRRYRTVGTFVGSIVDPEERGGGTHAPADIYGTGGTVRFQRSGKRISWTAGGGWATPRLDLNDLGYLRHGDYANAVLSISVPYNPQGKSRAFRSGGLNVNASQSWLYAGRTGYDLHTGAPVWSYRPGHRTFTSVDLNGWCEFTNHMNAWAGLSGFPTGTQRFDTRNVVALRTGGYALIPGGGPLIAEPATLTGWIGAGSDERKPVRLDGSFNYSNDRANNASVTLEGGVEWEQSSALHHRLEVSTNHRIDDTQHLENFENPGRGIGGVSYVYGRLFQRTLDLTLRSSVLFSRTQSLEVYAQPFLTVGSFSRPRELARADTYKLTPYEAEGFNVKDSDFRYASVNLNVVYRFEYRPGSALFLVWTQGRNDYAERGWSSDPAAFENRLRGEHFLTAEPENTFLAKLTWWLPV